MCKYFLPIFFVVLCSDLFAQSHSISGYVRDQSNGESLIGATLFDKRQNKGSVSNNFGFYSISTPYDSAVLTVSFVGFDPQTIKIKMLRDTSIVVMLRSNQVLQEVVIAGTRAEAINETTRMGSINVPTTQIKKIPPIAGEVDLFKALQLLPGVSSGAEGTSNLLVRGGNPDQTLILMDGAPIYNPTHMYGLFSTFNTDAINNVELIKGGFPARYGGRLSGVVDVTLKEGNMNKYSGEASLGLVASKFVIEGPIKKNKSSFLISARRGYLDVLGDLVAGLTGNGLETAYRFYDLNVKINHRINDKNRIYASAYTGQDYGRFDYKTVQTDSSGSNLHIQTDENHYTQISSNTVASLRWNHEINEKIFFNVSAYQTQYRLEIDVNSISTAEYVPAGTTNRSTFEYAYVSRIKDTGLKVDFDLIPNTNHYIRFGAAAIDHRFSPGIGTSQAVDGQGSTTTMQAVSKLRSKEVNAYVEDDFSISESTKINAGVHSVAYYVGDKKYYGLQPRLAIRHSLTPTISLKASYAYTQQFLQMLSNSTGLVSDFWVPATDRVKPVTANQVSLGGATTINKKFEFSVEGYYKEMQNLIEYKQGATYLDTKEPWESKISVGRGKAYGVEFFLQKKTGRLTGWVGYTLSWNKRQFDSLNHGNWFYYRYDHRHDLKITAAYEVNKHWDLSANFVYHTGDAVTLPLDMVPVTYNLDYQNARSSFYLQPAYESRNNFRMPAYHRIDLSGSYHFDTRKLQHRVTIAVYNAYNRLNPFYAYLDYQYFYVRLKTQGFFTILPSISYSIKF